jgi:DsbC/DsbD-like thiol-disulfide interchange protein
MSRGAAVSTVILLVICLLLSPLAGSQMPSGKDVTTLEAYVSRDPVARGMDLQVAVVVKIRNGFHMNARQVTEDYLIPTDLRIEPPAGFKLGAIAYPKGELKTFSFSKNKQLNVYTDAVIIRMQLTVLANAPLGAQHFPMKLHYQACSDEICLPPVTKDVDTTIDVVASNAAAKPANQQLFK